MSATDREHEKQLHAAEAACFRTEVALWSVEYHCQQVSVSRPLLQEEGSRLKLDKAWVQEQWALNGQRVCSTEDLVNSGSENQCNVGKIFVEVEAKYDQEIADVWYERHRLPAWMITGDRRNEVSCEPLRITYEHYRRMKVHLNCCTFAWRGIYSSGLASISWWLFDF